MSRFKKNIRRLRRLETRVLVAWVRYAKKNRQSQALPVVLFGLLYLDAFVMIIPSSLLVAASITIQPSRWLFFAGLFVLAILANHSSIYILGRVLPPEWISFWVDLFRLEFMFEAALQAITDYGKYATLLGGFLPLPTQLIMLILGLADTQRLYLADLELNGEIPPTSSMEAILFACIGHGIKITIFALIVRFGWMKLERKYS